MHIVLFVLGGTFVGVGMWQLAVWISETRHKNRKYESAATYAKKMNKPLLIAGGPWGTKEIRRFLNTPAHGNGDICLDIDPCAFHDHPRGVIADVTQIPFSAKSFGAAFASHLLEHLSTTEDAKRALAELNRVAEAVYIVYPSKQSIGAWVKQEHHLWVWQKGNVTYFKQRGESRGKRKEEYVNLIDQPDALKNNNDLFQVRTARK